MYRSVSRRQIVESLNLLRDLYRRVKPTSDSERLAAEQREVVIKYLISNMPRISAHPTLNALMEIMAAFDLSIGGVHSLFGYDLDALRQLDLMWNAGRTHIVESYVFERSRPIDLPLELAPLQAFDGNVMLNDLVLQWQRPVPITALDTMTWHRPGGFYVQVGTKDSLGASLPHGSIALVESIGPAEAQHPNPRAIYLLQFRNGYRCSRCVVTHGRLQLLATARTYARAQDFGYPGDVRIAGRVCVFAQALPQPEYGVHSLFTAGRHGADLILPWEHETREDLFTTAHRRFQRPREEEVALYKLLEDLFRSPLSKRTERRYRSFSPSQPHVSTLLQLTLAHLTRYSDSLRCSGININERGRCSLESLLRARNPSDAVLQERAHMPTPEAVWKARGHEFVDWQPLLLAKFPKLQLRDGAVMRLGHDCSLKDLDPPMVSGSWMLLENLIELPEIANDRNKSGWRRPLYVFRKGLDILTGYLERDGARYALLPSAHDISTRVSIGKNEISDLRRVAGVAVPV